MPITPSVRQGEYEAKGEGEVGAREGGDVVAEERLDGIRGAMLVVCCAM